jgi:hypothetical protein
MFITAGMTNDEWRSERLLDIRHSSFEIARGGKAVAKP